jgi:hypothetical protein
MMVVGCSFLTWWLRGNGRGLKVVVESMTVRESSAFIYVSPASHLNLSSNMGPACCSPIPRRYNYYCPTLEQVKLAPVGGCCGTNIGLSSSVTLSSCRSAGQSTIFECFVAIGFRHSLPEVLMTVDFASLLDSLDLRLAYDCDISSPQTFMYGNSIR